MKKIKRFKLSPKTLLIVASVLLVVVVVIGLLMIHRHLHHSDVKPNSTPPITGISLVFNPPLKHTATLEIDDSNEKILKTVSLVRANSQESKSSINNPLGVKYNVPLNEGVYRVKITSSKNDFPPFVSTVTVTDHKLTTENVGFTSFP